MKHGYMITIIVCAVWGGGNVAHAQVVIDLELRSNNTTPKIGEVVDVGLYAVAVENLQFVGLDVVLTWSENFLQFVEVLDNGPQSWNFLAPDFYDDFSLDDLNHTLRDFCSLDSVCVDVSRPRNCTEKTVTADCREGEMCSPLGVCEGMVRSCKTDLDCRNNDGNALLQAATFSEATATPQGLLVATLRFRVIASGDPAEVVIEETLGNFSRTQVLLGGAINVTGELGKAAFTIPADAYLWVDPVVIPAGRIQAAVVIGEIVNQDSFGVTMVLELRPRRVESGSVTFTQAISDLDVDIVLLGDPWPSAGQFDTFDTNSTGSAIRNGAVKDNGIFVAEATTFSGDLVSFPLTASADARGVWDLMLVTSDQTDSVSVWVRTPIPLVTGLKHGTVTVVDLGDSNASNTIEMSDLAQMQVCFSGDGFQYDADPRRNCTVFDFDDDQDVDHVDFDLFHSVITGPVP